MTERKIALYDIDKTSYQGFLVLDLCEYQFRKGILPEKNLLNIKRDIDLYAAGKLTYENMAQNVLAYWAEGLRGKDVDQIAKETKEFFQTEGNKFIPFVQESIDLFRPTHDTFFVTAEPQFVAKEVARIHQATDYLSTIFEINDGKFTGRVSSSLAERGDKKKSVDQIMQTYAKEQSFAFGDSDGDIEMLEGVEYPICVNPNDALSKKAAEKGWKTKKPEEVVLYIKDVLGKPKS